MNDKKLKSVSKFLSLVLRHQPETIGVELDENGWVSVQTLLDALKQSGKQVDLTLLQRVVHENTKQRFTFSDDSLKIRANQGHSIDIDLQLQPVEPPDVLFHGTVEKFLGSIREKGLIPGSRQHVHLSSDIETATAVGTRRGKPVLLIVQSKQMHQAGNNFFLSKNGVWLTNHVAPKFIDFEMPDSSLRHLCAFFA